MRAGIRTSRDRDESREWDATDLKAGWQGVVSMAWALACRVQVLQLKGLRSLNASRNHLSGLPDRFGSLRRLVRLSVEWDPTTGILNTRIRTLARNMGVLGPACVWIPLLAGSHSSLDSAPPWITPRPSQLARFKRDYVPAE